MNGPKSAPRFLPTLTEVVQPATFAAVRKSLPDDTMTQRIIEHLLPEIEQQLRDSLQALVQEHLNSLRPGLRAAIEAALKQAADHEHPQPPTVP